MTMRTQEAAATDAADRTAHAPRLPRTAPRRASRRDSTPDDAAISRVPFGVLVVGLLAGGLALLLGLNTLSAANELRRHSVSQKDQVVAAEVQQLREDVAASAAPGNLARVAEGLGMVPAGNPAFLVIGRNGRVHLLGSAAPATAPPLPTQAPPKPKHKHKPRATTTRTSKKAKHGAPRTTKKPRPTHTPTPTPTVTLPGGTR